MNPICPLSTHKPTGVPGVAAGRPGKLRAEGGEQVEEGPGLDHDVGDGRVGDHHLCGVAYPWIGATSSRLGRNRTT